MLALLGGRSVITRIVFMSCILAVLESICIFWLSL